MDREEFDRRCERAAKKDYVHIANTFPDESDELIRRLNEIYGDSTKAVETYTRFMIMAVAADGVLTLEEFMLLRSIFVDLAGTNIEYDDAVQIFMEKGFNSLENFKKILAEMKVLYDSLPDDLKEMIIDLCLMVCAVDGKVSEDEKTWVSILAVGSTGNESEMWDQISKDISEIKD